MIVILVAIWLGARGERRPLWVAVASATLAGLLSLAAYLAPNHLHELTIQALLSDKDFGTRLAGAIAIAERDGLPARRPDRDLRGGARPGPRSAVAARGGCVLLVPLLAALYLTYSRSAILAVFAIAVIVLWRWRRRVGVALLILGIVAGVAITPFYLQARGNLLGGSAVLEPGKVLIASDEQRITAWGAAAGCGSTSRSSATASGATRSSRRPTVTRSSVRPTTSGSGCSPRKGWSPGLLGVAFVLTVAWRLARIPGWLAAGALGAFVGWAITATFNNPFLFLQVNAIAFTVAGITLGLGRGPTPVAEAAAEEQPAPRMPR